MISYSAALVLRDSKVSLETLKLALEADHRSGASLMFHRRPGYTLVVGYYPRGDDCGALLEDAAAALARQLHCETAHIYAFAGTANHCETSGFDANGRRLWVSSPPTRASAESRAIEEKLGGRMLTEREVENLSDSDDADVLDDALLLPELPYWKLHLALELPGTSPHLELRIKSPLEVIGSGWKELGFWSRPLSDEEEKRRSAEEAERAKRLGVVRPLLEKALAKLAKDAGRDVYAVSVGEQEGVVTFRAATELARRKLHAELAKRSLMLRKSKLAKKTALRLHSGVWKALVVKGLTLDDVSDHLTVEEVRRHFGKVRVGFTGYRDAFSEFAPGSFEFDDPDQGVNAWNALCELRPTDVVQVLAEVDDPRLGDLFDNNLLEQAKLFVREDALDYVPLIAAALLASPQNGVLQTLTWMFLEPPVKKLAKDAAYVKTLGELFKKQPNKRMADALARVGVNVTPKRLTWRSTHP